MGQLRDCGFSGSDISRLVGGRWGDSAVRRCRKGSGVVDVSGRDALLNLVGEFAGGGGDLEDLARYMEAKRMLGVAGVDFEGATKLAGELTRCRGTVDSVSELCFELDGAGRTVGEVAQRIEVDRELQRLELTREVQLRLLGSLNGETSYKVFLDSVKSMGLNYNSADIGQLVSKQLREGGIKIWRYANPLPPKCPVDSLTMLAVGDYSHSNLFFINKH